MPKLKHCHCGNCFEEIRFTSHKELQLMVVGVFRPGPGGVPIPTKEKFPLCTACAKEYEEAKTQAEKNVADRTPTAVETGKLVVVGADGRQK